MKAKLAAINNKNGCGMAEVRCRQLGRISYLWYYHTRSGKIQLCSVVLPTKPAQSISSIFSSKIQLGPNWQPSTTKWLWHKWGTMQTFHEYFISLTLAYKVMKNTYLLCCTVNQVGTGHKLHFQPKIQLGPNWQQSTTKMTMARLRYDAERSEVFHIIDTIILGQETYSFGPLYCQPSGNRP